MSEPKRIQLRRTKGWRKPEGAIVVSRPSKWGNPFLAGSHGRSVVVDEYARWIKQPAQSGLLKAARAELRGHDLGCWCPLGSPCHADILLEVANTTL